jgi:hypothetical protein
VAGGAIIGTVLASTIRFNSGLVTAALALAALSVRGGSGRHTLLTGESLVGSPQLFQKFFLELAVLSALLGACWWLLRQMHGSGAIQDREGPAPLDTDGSVTAETSGLVVQLLITIAGILVLARSEAKQQVMASVLMASFAGAAISHAFSPTSARGLYWCMPLLVGLIGYGMAYTNPPVGVATADLKGAFAALVRPLPLDYASMGPAGAILGHWMSRRWQRERELIARASAEGVVPS